MLLVFLASGTFTTEVARKYRDKNQGFRVSVPVSWTVVPGRFHVSHHRYVQLTLNNCNDPDLRVKDWTEGTRTTYGPSTVSLQLPPGAVYIDVAKRDGPPPLMPPFAWLPDDLPESKIARFLADTPVHWDTAELKAYEIDFLKWGWNWDIRIYCRKPFEKCDLEEAFQIVRSLRFSDVPIATSWQAIEAVIPHLPEEARLIPKSDICHDYYRYDLDVERVDVTFIVTFTELDGTVDRRPIRSYEYLVSRQGFVEPIGVEK
jgi:hypothetical protein